MATKRFELMPIGSSRSIFKEPKVTHQNFPLSIVREQRPGAGWRKNGFGVLGANVGLIVKNYEPNQVKKTPKKEPRYSVKAANIRWLANVARWHYGRIMAEFGVTRSDIENAMRASSSAICIKPEQWDDKTNTLKGPLCKS